ncbi:glycosyltransferase family 4 protein [Caldicellulosiruptor morganii]|uniref:Glycosyltransferase family 4 protein n=1 Tax=Caldicellulosiruptor morganii TaxID=1387555 RepID=A0ABY7BQ31_9FIRM|nr:glycosyltransferase family 4 protein [Caldicellulosiruptor morganii]WAM33636.1 glycosyltransferase family 4 protein [Caldicellulosiruptor morganii]
MNKKILFVATVDYHFEAFHLPYFKMLKEEGWELHVAAKGDLDLPYCDKKFNIPIERSPYRLNNIRAYFILKRIIEENKYDLVHCHTPMGGVLARLAAINARKRGTKVLYTAHGFHFYKGAPIINWLLYYPIEKFLARYTDGLITINSEDYERAKTFKLAKDGKLFYVPGVGIDVERIKMIEVDKIQKRRELGIPENAFVLVSVGELIPRKNHSQVIKALSKIDIRSKNIYYLIVGKGILELKLKRLSQKLNIEDHVVFLGHRKDVIEILKASDVFVFPSKQEGLPRALMEAMACGLPVIATRIRGNVDLIEDSVNGLLIDIKGVVSFDKAIENMYNNKDLRSIIGKKNLEKISNFSISVICEHMKTIYNLYK